MKERGWNCVFVWSVHLSGAYDKAQTSPTIFLFLFFPFFSFCKPFVVT